MRSVPRILLAALGAVLLLLLPLAIPPADPVVPVAPDTSRPFEWRSDSAWAALESRFVAARTGGCADSSATAREFRMLDAAIRSVGSASRGPTDAEFDRLE